MKKISKRILSLLLAVSLFASAMAYTAYRTPEETQAAVVVDDLAIIFAILAACGCTYFGTQFADRDLVNIDDWDWGGTFTNSDDKAAFPSEVASAEETMKRLWDNTLNHYMEENGLTPDDFDPDQDDPNEEPPKWDQLKDWIKDHAGKLKIAAGGALAGFLGVFGYELKERAEKGTYMDDGMQDDAIPVNEKILGNLKSYKYYFIYKNAKNKYYPDDITYDYYFNNGKACLLDKDRYIMCSKESYFSHIYNQDGEFIGPFSLRGSNDSSVLSATYDIEKYSPDVYYTNMPIFYDNEDVKDYMQNGIEVKKYPSVINPDSISYDTDSRQYAQDNPEEKTYPVAPQVRVPTNDEIKQMYEDLIRNKDDEEGKQKVTDDFIDLVTHDTETDPTPSVTPDPSETPDPDNPDPTPSVTPDPGDDDMEMDDYKTDLRLVFPFCVPFDMIHLFEAFDAEPEAPVFEIPMDLELNNPATGKKVLDYHHTFKLDMSDYEQVVVIFRLLELILFILGLILVTRNLIRG